MKIIETVLHVKNHVCYITKGGVIKGAINRNTQKAYSGHIAVADTFMLWISVILGCE